MRLEHSLRNSTAALISHALNTVLAFVTRVVFTYTLSQTYLGLNGLFISFLSLLSLSELGIGTAITFALYSPLANRDEKQISALMNLYAKAYQIIGAIIAVLGIAMYPLIGFIVGEVPQVDHIYTIYLLFLSNTVLSYFFAYKRALLTADQRDWINIKNQAVILIIQNILQIVLLLTTKMYIPYLITQIVCTVVANVLINRKVNKLYPYLRANRALKVSPETFQSIRKNVSAMIMHQIGSVLVSGTDNMMIGWVDLALLGIYSNYSLVTQTISTLLRQVFNAITASVGNLVATEDISYQRSMYTRIQFVNFWLYGFFSVCIAILINPFITAWAPDGFLLDPFTVILIVVNFFLFGMRQTNIIYINTMGAFWSVRYKSLIEAFINLASSYIFMVPMHLGINGVLLGTVVSTITTNLWWEPYEVIKRRLRLSLTTYFLRYAGYILIALAAYFPVNALCNLIPGTGWLAFIEKGIVSTLCVNIIFLAILFRTESAHFLFQKVKSLILARIGNHK